MKGDGSDEAPFAADLPDGTNWTLLTKPKDGKLLVAVEADAVRHVNIMRTGKATEKNG